MPPRPSDKRAKPGTPGSAGGDQSTCDWSTGSAPHQASHDISEGEDEDVLICNDCYESSPADSSDSAGQGHGGVRSRILGTDGNVTSDSYEDDGFIAQDDSSCESPRERTQSQQPPPLRGYTPPRRQGSASDGDYDDEYYNWHIAGADASQPLPPAGSLLSLPQSQSEPNLLELKGCAHVCEGDSSREHDRDADEATPRMRPGEGMLLPDHHEQHLGEEHFGDSGAEPASQDSEMDGVDQQEPYRKAKLPNACAPQALLDWDSRPNGADAQRAADREQMTGTGSSPRSDGRPVTRARLSPRAPELPPTPMGSNEYRGGQDLIKFAEITEAGTGDRQPLRSSSAESFDSQNHMQSRLSIQFLAVDGSDDEDPTPRLPSLSARDRERDQERRQTDLLLLQAREPGSKTFQLSHDEITPRQVTSQLDCRTQDDIIVDEHNDGTFSRESLLSGISLNEIFETSVNRVVDNAMSDVIESLSENLENSVSSVVNQALFDACGLWPTEPGRIAPDGLQEGAGGREVEDEVCTQDTVASAQEPEVKDTLQAYESENERENDEDRSLQSKLKVPTASTVTVTFDVQELSDDAAEDCILATEPPQTISGMQRPFNELSRRVSSETFPQLEDNRSMVSNRARDKKELRRATATKVPPNHKAHIQLSKAQKQHLAALKQRSLDEIGGGTGKPTWNSEVSKFSTSQKERLKYESPPVIPGSRWVRAASPENSKDISTASRKGNAGGIGGTSGLRWQNMGTRRPSQGRQICNAQLATALQSKSEFTEHEWNRFGIQDPKKDDYIQLRGEQGDFFQLVEESKESAFARRQKYWGTMQEKRRETEVKRKRPATSSSSLHTVDVVDELCFSKTATRPPSTNGYAAKFRYNVQGVRGGGKFSQGQPKSDVDWKIYDASTKPSPGDYCVMPEDSTPSNGGYMASRKSWETKSWEAGGESDGKETLPGPGSYDIANPIPSGGRFGHGNRWREQQVFEQHSRELPGPAEYNGGEGRDMAYQRVIGGSIGEGTVMGDLDFAIVRASRQPGPGAHSLPPLGVTKQRAKGGKFSTAKPKSDVDWKVYDASRKPAPGQYDPPTFVDIALNRSKSRASVSSSRSRIAMSREYSQEGGARGAGRKTYVDTVQYHAAKLPGPGAYDTSFGTVSHSTSQQSLGRTHMSAVVSRPGMSDPVVYSVGHTERASVGSDCKSIDRLQSSWADSANNFKLLLDSFVSSRVQPGPSEAPTVHAL